MKYKPPAPSDLPASLAVGGQQLLGAHSTNSTDQSWEKEGVKHLTGFSIFYILEKLKPLQTSAL